MKTAFAREWHWFVTCLACALAFIYWEKTQPGRIEPYAFVLALMLYVMLGVVRLMKWAIITSLARD
jgi:hypothetical protein